MISVPVEETGRIDNRLLHADGGSPNNLCVGKSASGCIAATRISTKDVTGYWERTSDDWSDSVWKWLLS
jgi:hypothetical protein